MVLDDNSDFIKFTRAIHIVFVSNNLTKKKRPFFSNRGYKKGILSKTGRLLRGRAEWDESIAKVPESREMFTAVPLR